jgi:DNA-binding YbaB/EbfC family protein
MSDANQPGQPQMPDLSSLMAQAQEMMSAQSEAAAVEHEGQAGGGAVKVVLNANLEFVSVKISPEAVDPNDVEMLEDLVLAALNDAGTKIAEAQEDAMGGGLGGLDLGGLDLGGLLGGGDA